MEPWQLAANFGLAVGLCIFFVWRGDARELRMAKSLEEAQVFIREALIERDEERAAALNQLSAAMAKQAAAVDGLVNEMRATRKDRNGT